MDLVYTECLYNIIVRLDQAHAVSKNDLYLYSFARPHNASKLTHMAHAHKVGRELFRRMRAENDES